MFCIITDGKKYEYAKHFFGFADRAMVREIEDALQKEDNLVLEMYGRGYVFKNWKQTLNVSSLEEIKEMADKLDKISSTLTDQLYAEFAKKDQYGYGTITGHIQGDFSVKVGPACSMGSG